MQSIDRSKMIENLVYLLPILDEQNFPTSGLAVDHANGINFSGLKVRWGNGKLDQAFDLIEKYLLDHPNQQTFYVNDITATTDFENLPFLCVAMQTMVMDGLAKEQYQVVGPDNKVVPEVFDELWDIPEKYREYELKMLYVLCCAPN